MSRSAPSGFDRGAAEGFMRQALALARRARERTWPNPMVGAVVVRHGRVVGRGYHHRAGQAHAEMLALDDAGRLARGSELYVTLEPCHCWGRTPPCTERILAAGLRRVIVGACDPNPGECGAGLRRLRSAGLEVIEGVAGAECAALNEVYNVFICRHRPFVQLKAAISLDGRLSARSGDARWISSEESRRRAHRLRAMSGALLVGAGTVRADDPRLDVRLVRGSNPAVVVLDGALTTSPGARLFRVRRGAPVWIYCDRLARPARRRALERAGAEVIPLPGRNGRLKLRSVLADLLRRGVYRLLVEGGGGVIGQLLQARLIDRLELALAPILLGSEGVPLGRWRGPARVGEAPRLAGMTCRRLGPDIQLAGSLVWVGGRVKTCLPV